MVQAERVHRAQMSLNTIIITEKKRWLAIPLEAQGESTCQHVHGRLYGVPSA